MQKLAIFVLLFAFSLSAFGQATPQSSASATTTELKAGAEATATLIFYRPKRFMGSGLTPSVYVNGEEIARLDNGRYFVLAVKPGNLKISSSMKHDPTPVEAKAGKTEFFEMVILAGNWKGGGRLIPTPANDAWEALKKLKPLDKKWVKSDQVTLALPGETAAGGN